MVTLARLKLGTDRVANASGDHSDNEAVTLILVDSSHPHQLCANDICPAASSFQITLVVMHIKGSYLALKLLRFRSKTRRTNCISGSKWHRRVAPPLLSQRHRASLRRGGDLDHRHNHQARSAKRSKEC